MIFSPKFMSRAYRFSDESIIFVDHNYLSKIYKFFKMLDNQNINFFRDMQNLSKYFQIEFLIVIL